jgi:hypothetical protein
MSNTALEFSGRRNDKSRSAESRAETLYRKTVRREKYGKVTRGSGL